MTTLCRCGRVARISIGKRCLCLICLRYEQAILATRATEPLRRALFEQWQGRG